MQQPALLGTPLRVLEGEERTVGERATGGEQAVGVGLGAHPGSGAVRAGTLAAVEGEEPRIERWKPDPARRTEQALGVEALATGALDDHRAASEAERARELVLELCSARRDGRRHHEVDVVLAVAVEQPDARERDARAVDTGLHEAEL